MFPKDRFRCKDRVSGNWTAAVPFRRSCHETPPIGKLLLAIVDRFRHTMEAMVFLVLKPESVLDTVRLAKQSGDSLWIGSDAISREEHQDLVRDGVKVTRFSYPLASGTADAVADALATIEEHHPTEIIWVEHIRAK
jgi:hypothetical protein